MFYYAYNGVCTLSNSDSCNEKKETFIEFCGVVFTPSTPRPMHVPVPMQTGTAPNLVSVSVLMRRNLNNFHSFSAYNIISLSVQESEWDSVNTPYRPLSV